MTIDIPITIRVYAYPYTYPEEGRGVNAARIRQAFERYLEDYNDGRQSIAIEAFERLLEGWAARARSIKGSAKSITVRVMTPEAIKEDAES